ncbi:DUF2183 domain-containing protein [soil metagenome]
MHIAAYRGYATATHVFLSGRVLANRSPRELRGDERFWRSIANTYRRFQTDEVPDIAVNVRVGDREQTLRTDAEGYYHLELSHEVVHGALEMTAVARCRVQDHEISATHQIFAPEEAAEFGIISDLDDTVIETNVTRLFTAAKLIFGGNAKTRKPLEGVAALYASLQNGRALRPVNPLFYVSTSPWNLYDLLCDFMELNEIPRGPLFLRDWGRDSFKPKRTPGHRMKLERTLKLLADFPTLPFVLIGDSGQQDAGIYAEAAALHPTRIKAIYIRDVDPTTATRRDNAVCEHMKRAAQHNVPMLLVTDSNTIATHAAEIGLIASREKADVRRDVADDQERPSPAAAAVKEVLGIENSPSGDPDS